MLYSEKKERENRFVIALKIVFPFLFLVAIFFYFYRFFPQNSLTFALLTILIPIYVYYIVYLIYNGFSTSVIDPITKAFTRHKIGAMIQSLEDKKHYTIVLLHVENIVDINQRYGYINGDKVLRGFTKRLDTFLNHHTFKNTPIGRCGGGNFLLIIKYPQKELKHIFMQLSKEIKNSGIYNIEVKLECVIISADYDKEVKNSIEHLFILLEQKKKNEEEPLNIKPNEYHTIVKEAIKKNDIIFKYQPSLNIQTQNIEIFEVLPKIKNAKHGTLSKSQIERMVNFGGYEKEFEEKSVALLLDEVRPYLSEKKRFSLDISPVTLRNNYFKSYINTLFREQKIDPHFFILEITEKNSYEDMARFREILLSYKESGFQIALGNFGGNNCGFEYLKHLPIDLVKFDIEFTKKLGEAKYAHVFQSYLTLAHDLGVKTMVKFVDKEALFEKIKAFNPDYIQGFYISKPKKIGELDEIR